MANTTINSTNETVNSVSVSKEESIMATITIKNMAITNKHDKNYVSKAMLGEALGYSKTKLLKIKREDLVKEMTDKLTPKMTEEQLDNAVNTVVNANANGSNATIELPKELHKLSKEENSMDESKKMIEEKKGKTPAEKTQELYNDLAYYAKKNAAKGYGNTISGFMVAAVIAKQYDIYNLKGALDNDAKTRKAIEAGSDRPGRIIVTDEVKANIATVRKWLQENHKIQMCVITSDTHKNYYFANYDGNDNNKKYMTALTEDIYKLLTNVEVVSYRVF